MGDAATLKRFSLKIKNLDGTELDLPTPRKNVSEADWNAIGTVGRRKYLRELGKYLDSLADDDSALEGLDNAADLRDALKKKKAAKKLPVDKIDKHMTPDLKKKWEDGDADAVLDDPNVKKEVDDHYTKNPDAKPTNTSAKDYIKYYLLAAPTSILGGVYFAVNVYSMGLSQSEIDTNIDSNNLQAEAQAREKYRKYELFCAPGQLPAGACAVNDKTSEEKLGYMQDMEAWIDEKNTSEPGKGSGEDGVYTEEDYKKDPVGKQQWDYLQADQKITPVEIYSFTAADYAKDAHCVSLGYAEKGTYIAVEYQPPPENEGVSVEDLTEWGKCIGYKGSRDLFLKTDTSLPHNMCWNLRECRDDTQSPGDDDDDGSDDDGDDGGDDPIADVLGEDWQTYAFYLAVAALAFAAYSKLSS
tara:strand:+ start:15459 stop:16700 length:1242 start_codon:yes stop_codon:yes gene_type:complete